MDQRTIISEIALPDSTLCEKGYCIKELHGGNRFLSYVFPKNKERVISALADKSNVEIVVCCRETAKIILNYNFPNLKLIQLTSTGYDGVPVKGFAEKGIAVSNVKEVYDVAIAELVIAELLQFYRRVSVNPKSMIPDLFRRYNLYMNELSDKKAIILGTGNIGQCIARRLSAFDVAVDGYNRSGVKPDIFSCVYNDSSELLGSLSQYDLVVSTLPATESTLNYCNEVFFDKMKESALFFNVGRKSTVDEMALFRALKLKKIMGAIIDEVELLPFWPFNKFRRLPNTIVLPGIATSTVECKQKTVKHIENNLREFIVSGRCSDIIECEREK